MQNTAKTSTDFLTDTFGVVPIKKLNVSIETYKEPETPLFPLDVFPLDFQSYVTECNNALKTTPDFMACGLLFDFSVILGSKFCIEVKTGWCIYPSLYIACVGKTGVGKTHSIDATVMPLQKISNTYAYDHSLAYKEWLALSKKEKENVPEPKSGQFILDDVTIEKLAMMHNNRPEGLGIYRNELAGWFQSMDQYKSGSGAEENRWLEIWDNKTVMVNRVKTGGDIVIKNTHISLIGGVQPSILAGLFTDTKKESGLAARFLLSYPNVKAEHETDLQVNQSSIDNYTRWINASFTKINSFEQSEEVFKYSEDASVQRKRFFNEMADLINSDETIAAEAAMYAKMKNYYAKFSLLLHVINGGGFDEVTVKTALDAEKLCRYFIAHYKKVLFESENIKDAKRIINENKSLSKKDKIMKYMAENPKIPKTKIAEMFGVTKQYINKF
jgi:hypothetical protein